MIILGLNENATVEDVKSAVDRIVSENQDDLRSKEIDVRKYAEDYIKNAKYAGGKLISILESETAHVDKEVHGELDFPLDEQPNKDQLLRNILKYEKELENLKHELIDAEPNRKLNIEKVISNYEELVETTKELIEAMEQHPNDTGGVGSEPLGLVRLEMFNRFYDSLIVQNMPIRPNYEQKDENNLRLFLDNELQSHNETNLQYAIVCNSKSDANNYYETGKLKIFLFCLNGYENTPGFEEFRDTLTTFATEIGFRVEVRVDDKTHLYFSYKDGLTPDYSDDEIEILLPQYFPFKTSDIPVEDVDYELSSEEENSVREGRIRYFCELLGFEPSESTAKLRNQFNKKSEEYEHQLLTALPLEREGLKSRRDFFQRTFHTLEKIIDGNEHDQLADPIADERINMIIEFYEGLEKKDIICSQNYNQITEDDQRAKVEGIFPEIVEKKTEFYVICNSASDGIEYGLTGKLKITFLCWNGYELDPYFEKLKEAVVTFAKEVGFHVEAPEDDLTHIYLDARYDPISGEWVDPLK